MTAGKKLVVLAAVFAVVILMQSLEAQAPPSGEPEPPETGPRALLEPVKVDKKDDELHRLLKERYNEAVEEMNVVLRLFQNGRVAFDEVEGVGRRLLKAGLELKEKPEEKAALLRQYIDKMIQIEKYTATRVEQGRASKNALHKVRYYRIDAQIQLLRLKKTK